VPSAVISVENNATAPQASPAGGHDKPAPRAKAARPLERTAPPRFSLAAVLRTPSFLSFHNSWAASSAFFTFHSFNSTASFHFSSFSSSSDLLIFSKISERF